MNKVLEYINSGILEMYVLGITNASETAEVFQMALLHPEIQKEIEEISVALEIDSASVVTEIKPTLKITVLATIDYMERLKAGETPTFPPMLSNKTKIIDFKEWTERTDMVLPNDFDEFYAKIIGYTPAATTSIAWIKTMSPLETHTTEYERFFILEGSCDVIIEGNVHPLVPGDFIEIPLNKVHVLKVTSTIPCKIILQHVAA